MISIEHRKKIKERLPHGSIKKIARVANARQSYVSMWFKGITNSPTVEKAVFEVYHEEIKRTQKILSEAGLI